MLIRQIRLSPFWDSSGKPLMTCSEFQIWKLSPMVNSRTFTPIVKSGLAKMSSAGEWMVCLRPDVSSIESTRSFRSPLAA